MEDDDSGYTTEEDPRLVNECIVFTCDVSPPQAPLMLNRCTRQTRTHEECTFADECLHIFEALCANMTEADLFDLMCSHDDLVRCVELAPTLEVLRKYCFLDFVLHQEVSFDPETWLPSGGVSIAIFTRRRAPNGRLQCPSSPVRMATVEG